MGFGIPSGWQNTVKAIRKASWSSTLLAVAGIVVMSVLSYRAGEQQAKPEYDFDLECDNNALSFDEDLGLDVFVCSGPYFRIMCDPKTVQHTREGWYCKTSGSESVRIKS